MDEWITQLISTVGVPSAICFFVLTQLKKTVDANTKAIMMLSAKFGIEVKEGA
jgi:hypothetical protein